MNQILLLREGLKDFVVKSVTHDLSWLLDLVKNFQ